jgi:hypothetical protein
MLTSASSKAGSAADDGGLSAAIYTQTSDVENRSQRADDYDRAAVKMDAERITEANRKVLVGASVHRLFARRGHGVAGRFRPRQRPPLPLVLAPRANNDLRRSPDAGRG